MAKLNKKKVSFDIDPDLLDDIKKYCVEKKIKQADFLRDAAKEKLAREEYFMCKDNEEVFIIIDRTKDN